jgi:hypothetical protein
MNFHTAAPIPRASDIFGNAGPLLDPSGSSSNRKLDSDQVFARLLKQTPASTRDDKRERVYKWMDNVAQALTFNPDTSIPGWIIPIIPDRFDDDDKYCELLGNAVHD